MLNYFIKRLLGLIPTLLIVAVLVVISQPFKAKKRDLFGR